MYEQFFGLERRPFSLAPDPDFLFWTRQHRLGSTILELGVERQSPITLVTGAVGTGKTTLIRQFLRTSPRSLTIGLLSNYLGDHGDLYRWILMAFGQDQSGSARPVLLGRLQHFFLSEYAAGRRAVLMVDEAQSLSDQGLELMRLLTNINVGKDVVMMLVLVGQTELRERLKRPECRQIVQRIGAHFDLAPMTAEETRGYVAHRLEVAGGSPTLIAPGAADLLHAVSGGIPRVLNTLGDMCLVAAFGEGVRDVDAAFAASVIDEARANGSLAVLPPAEPSRIAGILPDPRLPRGRRGPREGGGDVVALVPRSGREAVAFAHPAPDEEAAVARLRADEVGRLAPDEEPMFRFVAPEAAKPAPEPQPDLVEARKQPEAPAVGSRAADPMIAGSAGRDAPAATGGRDGGRTLAGHDRAAAGGERGRAVSDAALGAAASPNSAEVEDAVPSSGSRLIAAAEVEAAAAPGPDADRRLRDGGAAPAAARRRVGALPLALAGALALATGLGVALFVRGDSPTLATAPSGAAGPPTAIPRGAGPAQDADQPAEIATTEGVTPAAEIGPATPDADVSAPQNGSAPDSVGIPDELVATGAAAPDEPPAVASDAAEAIAPEGLGSAGIAGGDAAPPSGTAEPPAALPEADAAELYRTALSVAVEDPRAAATAFARAAARGHARSAYFLGQMYETGDGVPLDFRLAQAWYAAAGGDQAEARMAALAELAPEVSSSGAPGGGAGAAAGAAAAGEDADLPGLPVLLATGTGAEGVDLVWTSAAGPDPAAFQVELASAPDAEPIHTAEVSVSALHLEPPPEARVWRVIAAGSDGQMAASAWAPLPDRR